MLGALLALGALLRITPPAKGQYFPPALPGTFGDIATPSVAPPAGATRVYTKSGTVCAFSPLSVETCTGSGGSGVTFAAPYVTSGANTFGPNWALTIPPLTGWTQIGSPTFDTTSGYPYTHGATAAATTTLRGVYRSAPSAPYSVNLLLAQDFSGGQGSANGCSECALAIGFTDGTKFTAVDIGNGGGTPSTTFAHWTNNTTVAGVVQTNSGVQDLVYKNPTWWKLCDDSTNIKFYWSIDGGGHWINMYSEARASFLSSPANIFTGSYNNNGPVDVAVLSYATTNACP